MPFCFVRKNQRENPEKKTEREREMNVWRVKNERTKGRGARANFLNSSYSMRMDV